MKLLPSLNKVQRDQERRARIYRDLLHREAKIGGEIFGAVGNNGRREFFWLDGHTWVWHEEWTDQNGQPQVVTTRYDIRPNGTLKSQNNGSYRYIGPEEVKRLRDAIKLYKKRVAAEIYGVNV